MFKRNNTTELVFHTSGSQDKLDLFAPRYGSSKLTPSWFKSITKNPEVRTLRNCPGFVNLLKDSIGLPLWADFAITYKGNELRKVEIAGYPSHMVPEMVQPHHPIQWGDGFPGALNIKLMSPWYVTSNKSTPFLMHDAVWHKERIEDYQVLSGILDLKRQHSTHVNMMLPYSEKEKTVLIKAGTIMWYLTPMVDTKVEIKTKWVTEERLRSFMLYRFSFNDNDYRQAMKIGEILDK
jgi:hypothetical protein